MMSIQIDYETFHALLKAKKKQPVLNKSPAARGVIFMIKIYSGFISIPCFFISASKCLLYFSINPSILSNCFSVSCSNTALSRAFDAMHFRRLITLKTVFHLELIKVNHLVE